MDSPSRCLIWFGIFPIWMALSGLAQAGPLLAQSEEPVLLEGAQLPGLNGVQSDHLGVFAYRGGFAPIPFQVDERDPNGQWVLREGPAASSDVDQGRLDANDEMVFMASDLGERAPAGRRPEGGKSCVEVSARDPRGPAEAFAYVCAFDSPPVLSKADYVAFESTPKRWLVKTPFYQMGGLGSEAYFDRLRVVSKEGAPSDNLLDAQKVRAILNLGGEQTRLQITERNSKIQTRGWCDGPVRVIRVRRGMIKIAALEITIPGFAANYNYRSYFKIPLKFDLPLNANLVFRHVNFSTTLDYAPAVYGWRYYDALHPAGLTVDGVMDAEEKNLNRDDQHAWYALAGKPGAVLVRIQMGANWNGSVIPTLFYLDDAAAVEPLENIPGAVRFGFQFQTVHEIPKGMHDYDLYGFFPREYSAETRDKLFQVVDSPLAIKISDH